MGFQMLGVAVGWQLYELTGSALDLGLVGLVRLIVVLCEIVKAAAAAALALGSMGGWQSRTSIFALVALLGAAQAFESGVVAALIGTVPSVVIGGLGTILVAALWMTLFPELRRLRAFEE